MAKKLIKKAKKGQNGDISLRYGYQEPEQTTNKRTGEIGYKIGYYYWYENGKRRRNNGTWHLTKEECIKEVENRVLGNVDIKYIQSKMTIKELIIQYKEYITNVDIDEIAPSTKLNRADNCNTLLKYSPEKDVLSKKIKFLDVNVLKFWLNALKTTKSKRTGKVFSSEYYDGLKNTINLILSYADVNNYFDNSLERYTSLKNFIMADKNTKSKRKEYRYLDYYEFQRFATCILYDYDVEFDDIKKINMESILIFNKNTKLDFKRIKYKNYVYFMFMCCMYFLGTRTEECRVLNFDNDIDFNAGDYEGRVSITKAFTSYYFKSDTQAYIKKMRTKNAGSIRKIPIHPILKNLLVIYKEYIDKHNLSHNLFPGDDNGFLSYSQINHKIERALVSAGMKDKKFTKHDFRRSAAMFLCYNLKLPKDQAIAFFGWTSTDMLDEVYLKFNELQRAEMLEKNLDDVGFFKLKPNMFFIEDGKVYFGKEAELKYNKKEADEYDKAYRKNEDFKKGYDIKDIKK